MKRDRIKTIPPPAPLGAILPEFSQWAAGLPGPDEWAAELETPWQDAHDVDTEANPEARPDAQLSADLAHARRPTRRLFVDYRANPDAFRHIQRLPRAGESLHGIISGRYALWDLVPAIIERNGGRPVAELYLCTLSYSKTNAAELLGLLDAGKVKRATLVISTYFLATNKALYDLLVPELLARGQRVIAMRSHCKILLLKTTRDGAYTCESSANLRSSKNVEQFVLTRCPKLYQFHRAWIDELIGPPK
jgi:hypothetical protein